MSGRINLVMDATMLDTFQVCPAKFNYSFNLNRTTPTKATPLDKGGIMHVGFETYYKNLAAGLPFVTAVDNGLVDMRKALTTNSDLSTEDGSRCLEVFEENTEHWRLEDQSLEIEAVEEAFSYVLFENDWLRIVMTGKIDLLFSNNHYSHCPMDHKTYDRDSQFATLRLANQFTNYAVATDSNFLFVNRVGFPKTVKPEDKYRRIPLSYDPFYKNQWKKNVVKWMLRYLDSVQENDWPMDNTSCNKFNRLCEYYEVCDTSGEDNKLYKLESSLATKSPWDVSAKLVKK